MGIGDCRIALSQHDGDVGDRVGLTIGFFDEDGAPADPSSVTVGARDPSGNESQLSYTQESTGVYLASALIDESGRWWFRAVGSGAIDAAADSSILIRATEFTTSSLVGGIVGVLHQQDSTNDPSLWSSVRLDARSPEYGRVLCRSYPNPGASDYDWNTVLIVSTNVEENGNPEDPAVAAVGMAFETSYDDVRPQSEIYAQVRFDGDEWRPFYSRFYLDGVDAKTFDNQWRGRTVVLGDDGASNILLTLNPATRTMALADDGEIRGTGASASVTIRGVIVSGGRAVQNNNNTPVRLAGVQMSGTDSWHHIYPRRYSQESRPTLPEGARAIWRKPSTNEVKILYNDPDEGHVASLLSAAP